MKLTPKEWTPQERLDQIHNLSVEAVEYLGRSLLRQEKRNLKLLFERLDAILLMSSMSADFINLNIESFATEKASFQ